MNVVTPDELWRAVGESLLLHRTRKRWTPIDIERHGGPTYKTVQAIESGNAGRVDVLSQHAEALGLSIVDVLRSVLERASEPLGAEIEQIVRKFGTTTVEGRQAMLSLTRALPDARAAATPPAPRRQSLAAPVDQTRNKPQSAK